MDIRDKVIVVKVPSGLISEPKNETMTKKEVLAKLEAEFVRVSAHYYNTRKSRSIMKVTVKGCLRRFGS